jgi:hypothetical protein
MPKPPKSDQNFFYFLKRHFLFFLKQKYPPMTFFELISVRIIGGHHPFAENLGETPDLFTPKNL